MSQKFDSVSLNPSNQRSTSRPPCFNVAFDRDTDFVHRLNITGWLKEKYTGPSSRMALVGFGGLGNKLPRRNDPGVDVLTLVRDWLQSEEAGSWLMILDNADDINLFCPKDDHGKSVAASVVGGSATATTDQRPLAACLPKYRNGKILVTSRSLDVAEKLTGTHKNIFQVSIMDVDQGLQLLCNKLVGECDEGVVIELLRDLDFIPLAITQAAAYINRRSPLESVETYLTTFRESDLNKRSPLNRDAGDLRRNETVSNSVITTWQVTFEHVRREKPSAAKLLSFMSFFNPHSIPLFVLHDFSTASIPEADTETASFEDDLDVLRGCSLVTVTASADLCEMHAMVQACTRIWVSASDGVEHWKRLFLQLMCKNFPNGSVETWPNCKLLLPHIELVTEVEPPQEDLQDWTYQLGRCGRFMNGTGNLRESERVYKRLVTVYSATLGEDHKTTLESKHCLALLYVGQGRNIEAEQIFKELLDTNKMVSQEEDLEIWRIMYSLALVHVAQGRMKEAEAIYTRLVETLTRVSGREHPDTLRYQVELASTLIGQNRANDADEILVPVLAMQKKVLGEEHLDTLLTMSRLALSYGGQDRYEEAEDIAVRVLEAYTRIYGKEHPVCLLETNILAKLYWKQGRLSAAEDILAPSVILQKKVLGKEHPSTRDSMELLGAI
ncbi:P-loop containing nucleoside triphosphate hydrolase protein [Fusarium acuminatum]|uniref:P-loop containing nucleoside triphosphate hydrolase protein n=1 Tax=Fusarium acuminatum TaxID=5515 RepID=A0ABZ2X2M5_9HYPO